MTRRLRAGAGAPRSVNPPARPGAGTSTMVYSLRQSPMHNDRTDRAPLAKYQRELLAIFKQAASKHDAHYRSRKVLLDMAADANCLRFALAAEIRRPGGLNTRHFPSLGFPVLSNRYFHLVANCFFPLASGETDITTNSVHHHGDLLLTTVTTFGPGYEHWRFTKPVVADEARDIFSLAVIDREKHGCGHAAFVDSFMPHAVMFPASLTVTLALWSSRHDVSWLDYLKGIRALERRREWLLQMAQTLGIRKALKLNVITYFDFFPVREGFKGMANRVQFQRGPNEDYLYSLFHILQQTGNEDLAPGDELRARLPIDHPRVVEQLVRDLQRGVPIAYRFSEGVHWLPHMNFKVHAIDQALASMTKTPPSYAATGAA